MSQKAGKSSDERVAEAIAILASGLKYYEHDGHDMPKQVARLALQALGVPHAEQPGGWDTDLPTPHWVKLHGAR